MHVTVHPPDDEEVVLGKRSSVSGSERVYHGGTKVKMMAVRIGNATHYFPASASDDTIAKRVGLATARDVLEQITDGLEPSAALDLIADTLEATTATVQRRMQPPPAPPKPSRKMTKKAVAKAVNNALYFECARKGRGR